MEKTCYNNKYIIIFLQKPRVPRARRFIAEQNSLGNCLNVLISKLRGGMPMVKNLLIKTGVIITALSGLIDEPTILDDVKSGIAVIEAVAGVLP